MSKSNTYFLRETLQYSHKLTNEQLLIRMDSGNDAKENLGIVLDDGSWFIVKRNMRRGESSETWLSEVKNAVKIYVPLVMARQFILVLLGNQ